MKTGILLPSARSLFHMACALTLASALVSCASTSGGSFVTYSSLEGSAEKNPKPDAIVGTWKSTSPGAGTDQISTTYKIAKDGTGTETTRMTQNGVTQEVSGRFRYTYQGNGRWTAKDREIAWQNEFRISQGKLLVYSKGGGVQGGYVCHRVQ